MSAPASTQPDSSLSRRSRLLPAVAAGLCWACALALLLSSQLEASLAPLAPLRLIYYGLVLAAALLTFVPFQRRLGLPGLALEGVGGAALLFYTLAFVPPPTGWLLALPDLPVYALLALGLFWCASAAALPPIYALGQRLFRERARRYDLRRARRQAHSAGVLLAVCVLLAGLRALEPIPIILVTLLLIVVELLLLSYVEPAGS